MDIPINRLATFLSCPDDVLIPTVKLCDCGFFYTLNGDEVECFQCHIKINNWKTNDIPALKHIQKSPNCPVAISSYQNVRKEEKSKENVSNKIENQSTRSQSLNYKSGSVSEKLLERTNQPAQHKSQILLNNSSSKRQDNAEFNSGSNQKGDHPISIKSNEDIISILSEQPNSPEANPELANLFVKRSIEPNKSDLQNTDYTVERNRAASFIGNWPITSPISPNELVDAGLYYIGPGDKVKCAWCKGGLYNWEVGDTAIGEHVRHFPQCNFIKQKISQTLQPKASSKNIEYKTKGSEGNTNDTPQQWKECPAVKIAIEMGYAEKQIEKAIQILPSSGMYNTDKLLDALFELETSTEQSTINLQPDESQPNDLEGAMVLESATNRALDNSNFEKKTNQDEMATEEISLLMDENLRLKETTTCKICLESDVNTLFLPCRHLVCCEECSEAVRHCPLCRTLIVGTVKTFLS